MSTELDTLKTNNTKLTADLAAAQAEVTAKVTEITTLTKQLEDQKPQVELGQKFLTDTRNEALRLYNLVEGAKATTAMQTLIKDASLDVAKSFVTSYSERAEQVAPLRCTKCGSTELQRRTSASSEVPPAEGKGKDKLVNDRLKSTVASIHG
jgi:predicted  nucleic acid-binding Zn-ribbon protein